MNNVERELKLRPSQPQMLDRLAAVDRLGELGVVRRRHEAQRNSFFDSSSRALGQARVGFRRRTIDGQAMATWTLKADSEVVRGVASRTEIELQLDPDTAPALALGALRDAARQRGATELADAVDRALDVTGGDALAGSNRPLAEPFLVMETDRTILELEAPARGWRVELALDRVRLLGHAYAEQEIEAELKRGDETALEAARVAIEALGPVENSTGGKLARALAHLQECKCSPVAAGGSAGQ